MAELAAVFRKRKEKWADLILEDDLLYLGSGTDAGNLAALREHGIKCICNGKIPLSIITIQIV